MTDTWAMGTCAYCGSPVHVMSCPCEIAPASDYLWWCTRSAVAVRDGINHQQDECPNNTRPQHTGDMEHPEWVVMP